MADEQIIISDLPTIQSAQDDDYVVITDGSQTSKIQKKKFLSETNERIEDIDTSLVDKMERIVLVLSQENSAWVLKYDDGVQLTFNELYEHCRNKSHYIVVLIGNSKLRPQYVSQNEIHCDGEDRDSQGSLFMRMIMTPTILYYQTFRQVETSDLSNYYTKNEAEERYLKKTVFDALGLYVSNGYICQKIKGE